MVGRAANPTAERGEWEAGVLKQITHSQLDVISGLEWAFQTALPKRLGDGILFVWEQ